jgi:hypothetical protein
VVHGVYHVDHVAEHACLYKIRLDGQYMFQYRGSDRYQVSLRCTHIENYYFDKNVTRHNRHCLCCPSWMAAQLLYFCIIIF